MSLLRDTETLDYTHTHTHSTSKIQDIVLKKHWQSNNAEMNEYATWETLLSISEIIMAHLVHYSNIALSTFKSNQNQHYLCSYSNLSSVQEKAAQTSLLPRTAVSCLK